MLLTIAANAIFLPIFITFYTDKVNKGWILFNTITDLLYLVDIVFNFWTGTIDKDYAIILELSKLRKIYLKRWFFLDIISTFPFDYIALVMTVVISTDTSLQNSKMLIALHLIEILSLLRLLKLIKFLNYVARWQEVYLKL